MRLLFVVQRYGRDVFGGAEQFCRDYATRLVERGHDVHVLTSCALSYVDWADHYAPGDETLDGVVVHRMPVASPRDNDRFNGLNTRVNAGYRPSPLLLQREWMRQQGPLLDGFTAWLEREAGGFDVAVFVGYLYWTTWAGLPVASSQVPTVLHPTAHDEPPIYLPLFDANFRHPSAFGFLTPEEAQLVERLFRVRRRSIVNGVGVDLDRRGDERAFRERFGLDDDPYLLYVGRIDPHKGTTELHAYFTAYKQRNPSPLKLVMVGEPVHPLPPHPDVVTTGFVDGDTWVDSFAGATALVNPSYFESFSMALVEAWAQSTAAIVQGRCDVLRGQARRSGGALPYSGFGEFEAAVDELVGDDGLRSRLGALGRSYVEANYAWPDLLDRYEGFVGRVAAPRRLGAIAG